MTDPIQRLRAADAVDESTLEIPAALALRALTPPPAPQRARRRRAAVVGLGVAIAFAVAVVLASGGSKSLDPAARAYAAMDPGNGITHWVETVTSTGADPQIYEGWSDGDQRHVEISTVEHGKRQLATDLVFTSGQETSWNPETGNTQTGPGVDLAAASKNPEAIDGLDGMADPWTEFRLAYRAGRLRQLGPTTYIVAIPPCCIGTYAVDRNGTPTRFVWSSPDGASTTTFDVTRYEHLPLRGANRHLLDALPHPLMRPLGTAIQMFGALRSGPRPDGRDRAMLENDLQHLSAGNDGWGTVDLDDVRLVGDTSGGRMYLESFSDHLCLAMVGNLGVADGCTTLGDGERHGVSVNGVYAVPDGVTSVRFTFNDGTSQVVTVKHALAIPTAGDTIKTVTLRRAP